MSIAGVALANGLNANVLRKWVNWAERSKATCGSQIAPRAHVQAEPITGFVPRRLPAPCAQPDCHIMFASV